MCACAGLRIMRSMFCTWVGSSTFTYCDWRRSVSIALFSAMSKTGSSVPLTTSATSVKSRALYASAGPDHRTTTNESATAATSGPAIHAAARLTRCLRATADAGRARGIVDEACDSLSA